MWQKYNFYFYNSYLTAFFTFEVNSKLFVYYFISYRNVSIFYILVISLKLDNKYLKVHYEFILELSFRQRYYEFELWIIKNGSHLMWSRLMLFAAYCHNWSNLLNIIRVPNNNSLVTVFIQLKLNSFHLSQSDHIKRLQSNWQF